MSIENELKDISSLVEDKKYDTAIAACDKLVKIYPDDSALYDKRARIYARKKQWDLAVNDITTAIDINCKEPDFYFTRARYLINLGKYQEAIIDLNKSISLEEEYGSSYYIEAAIFFRAYSEYKLGFVEDALKDLQLVRDDSTMHLDGKVHTKNEILKLIRRNKGE